MAASKKLRRWKYVVNALVVLLVLGIIYAWSIFVKPLENEFNWTRDQTSVIFTISLCFYCLGAICSGFISAKIGSRLTMIISAILIVAGFVMCTFVTSLILFYIFYGVFCGFGVGMCYNAVISTTNAWFPDKRGTVSGIMLMGFGLSGVIFSNVISVLLEKYNWRIAFIVIGIIAAAIAIFGSVLAKKPSPDIELPAPKGGKSATAARDFKTGEMLRTQGFWMYTMYIMFAGAACLAIVGHAAMMATETSINAGLSEARASSLATFAVSAFSLCNGAGRLLTGIFYDKIGRKRTMITVSIISIIGIISITLAYVAYLPYLFIAGAAILAISYGGMATTSPAVVAEFFGNKYYSLNFAVLNSSCIASAILGPTVIGAMYAAGSGSYTVSLIVMCVYCVLGLIGSLTIRKPEK